MKVFTRDYRISHHDSALWNQYFGRLKPCILDIETTGLSPSRGKVIMTALLTETDDGLRITQFLAQNHYEEYKVLEATLTFLKEEGIGYITTFNGQAFDVPFINSRLEANHMEERCRLYNFDLYRWIKKYSCLSNRMSSLSQKSLEIYYGIGTDRKDIITGKESLKLFNEYAIDGNGMAEKIILTHNREDVLQLYKLLKLSGADDFSSHIKSDFHTAIGDYGFPTQDGSYSVRTYINTHKNKLIIRGDQLKEAAAAAFFPDGDSCVSAIFNATLSSYEITVPMPQHMSEYYIDLNTLGLNSLNGLADDPDCVNNYLIMNPRTVNRLAGQLVSFYGR